MNIRATALLTLLLFVFALSASFGHEEEFFLCKNSPQQCVHATGSSHPSQENPDVCLADLDEYSATRVTPCELLPPAASASKPESDRPSLAPSVKIEILPPVPIAA